MKKIFKKIKAKHLARVGLVMMLGCYIAMFLCSATNTVNIYSEVVDYSNPLYNVQLMYTENGELKDSNFYYGEDLSLSYDNKYISNADYICSNGTLTSRVDGAYATVYDVDLPDGSYNLLLCVGSVVSSIDGFDYFIGLGDSQFNYLKTVGDSSQGLIYEYYYSESIPSDVYIYFDGVLQGEHDYRVGTNIIYYIIVPASPNPEIVSITNVWSSVGTWVYSSFTSVVGIFWNGNSLTLIGSICLVGTGIAICLLIFNKVKDFLHLQ